MRNAQGGCVDDIVTVIESTTYFMCKASKVSKTRKTRTEIKTWLAALL